MIRNLRIGGIGASLIIALAVLFSGITTPAEATWQLMINEDFEYAVGTSLHFDTDWSVFPTPPNPPPPTARWDIERNAIYHPGGPNDVSSVWCVGSAGYLQPGADFYEELYWPYGPPVLTYLYQEDFDLSDAVAGGGSFALWAAMEVNSNDTGDFFAVAIRNGPFDDDINAWDWLYRNDIGGTNNIWMPRQVDFEEVISGSNPDDTLSYLGYNDVTIAFIFSCDTDNNDYLGAFLDDVNLGYDDGMFDFEARDFYMVNPDDPDLHELQYLYVGQPVQPYLEFKAKGNMMSNVVSHTLYGPGNITLAEIRQAWQGSSFGTTYEELFDFVFTPTDTGTYGLTVYLDSDLEQPESNENNNSLTSYFTILAENTLPWIEFVDLDPDTLWTENPFVTVRYIAHNSPLQENATVSLYFDTDSTGTDGYPAVGPANLPITNELDSVIVDLSNIGYGDYYAYARMEDDYWPDVVYQYSENPIAFREDLGVAEQLTAQIPAKFHVMNAYPNPFNPTVEIQLAVPNPGNVEAVWYSIDGREADRQDLGRLNAGEYRFSWTPRNLPSGVYLLKAQGPQGIATQKVTYLK